MILMEALEQLNSGKSLTEIASMAGISVKDLERKLANAAVEFDQGENEYKYKGIAPEESLNRELKSRIVVLSVDKPFIKKKSDNRETKSDVENIDIEYIMFKDYQKVDHSLLTEKKTFFLTEEMYQTIKNLSVEKSYKINALINILLEKGLEYYNINLIGKDWKTNSPKNSININVFTRFMFMLFLF